MASDDIRAIVSKLSRRPYVTQEIVDTAGSIGGEYTDIGDVQELVFLLLLYAPFSYELYFRFRYAEALKAAFTGGGIAGLKGVESRGMRASKTLLRPLITLFSLPVRLVAIR
jgi:hypothetical protein